MSERTTVLDEAQFLEDEEGEPDLSQVLEQASRAAAADLHVSAPCVLGPVDMADGTCQAKPVVGKAGEDAEPMLPDVRMLQLRSGDAYLQIPITAETAALLVYANRSLDEWSGSDGTKQVKALDPRTHDPTDAVALPFAPHEAESGAEDAIVLSHTDVRLGSAAAIDAAVKATAACQALQAVMKALPPATEINSCCTLANAIAAFVGALTFSTKVKVD